jgi:predicted TIM-barrel fold metal-dependent hydrolase
MARAATDGAAVERKATTVVDTDVHVLPRSAEELLEYVPEPWRSRSDTQFLGAGVYVPPVGLMRKDGFPPEGPPGSDPDFLCRQLLGESGIDLALLIPLVIRPQANPEHEAALASGLNGWQEATWLTRYNGHGRFFGSIIACPRQPELAVREIERWAGHPLMKQVVLVPSVYQPFGEPHFRPVFEAAVRHGLPVALHMHSRLGMFGLTPVGFPSYYFDMRSFHSNVFAAHLTSMVFGGLFEDLPDLRVAIVEGGYIWALPLMWRLDRNWEDLRSEVPHLRRRPSEYLREQVWFTTQPFERPRDPDGYLQTLDWLSADRRLMFATDYPHWDGDYLPNDIVRGMPDAMRERVLAGNALELYGLPHEYEASGTVA